MGASRDERGVVFLLLHGIWGIDDLPKAAVPPKTPAVSAVSRGPEVLSTVAAREAITGTSSLLKSSPVPSTPVPKTKPKAIIYESMWAVREAVEQRGEGKFV